MALAYGNKMEMYMKDNFLMTKRMGTAISFGRVEMNIKDHFSKM